MNPVLSAAVGSILRWAFALAAGYLVKAGIWTGSDAETYVAAGSLAALGLGWSLWNKYRGRLKLLTALSMPIGATENDVKAKVAAGDAPPVTTHPDSIPVPSNLPVSNTLL